MAKADLKLVDATRIASTAGDILNLGAYTAADRRKMLAANLINTAFFPPGFAFTRQIANEAEAYHNLRPYPWWEFANWDQAARGPFPRCLPLPRRIVKKGAKWLFGKPAQIHIAGNEGLEKYFRETWQKNGMPTKMVAGAEKGGVQGGIALKWAYDETADPKLSFQLLSVINECRLFYDPHDSDTLLMARIQYPVFNGQDGNTYIYREEWTDDEEIHYRPIKAEYSNLTRQFVLGGVNLAYGTVPVIANSKTEPDRYGEWEITSRRPNPFGVIPLWPIRNTDNGTTFGSGDLWTDTSGGMFRVIDRINLTFHSMDKSNQMDGERNIVLIDLNAGKDRVDLPFQPGQVLSAKSDPSAAGTEKRGQVVELQATGAMRPHMMDYASELRHEILGTVGSVDVRTEEITNKGNLTQAVLTQLYAPLIETTEEKRKTYGEDGIAKLLERCALGMKNLGAKETAFKSVRPENEESFDVQIQWPQYFQLTEEEKAGKSTRVIGEVNEGFMTHERAVEIIGQIEGVEDIPVFKKELEAVAKVKEQQQIQKNSPEPVEPDVKLKGGK